MDKKKFIVTNVVTLAGKVTRNSMFYLPSDLKKGLDSWMSPYRKPLIMNHDVTSQPVGRAVAVRYVDYTKDSESPASAYKGMKGLELARVLLKKGGDAWKDSFPGLGHIEVDFEVYDEADIEKFKSGRWLTNSSGFSFNKLMCPICGSDWLKDGWCEHDSGEVYDGVMMALVPGDFTYDENSLVNVPAVPSCQVKSMVYTGEPDEDEEDKKKMQCSKESELMDEISVLKAQIEQLQKELVQLDSREASCLEALYDAANLVGEDRTISNLTDKIKGSKLEQVNLPKLVPTGQVDHIRNQILAAKKRGDYQTVEVLERQLSEVQK